MVFLELVKAQNKANYVDVTLSGICPYNLVLFNSILSSVLKSNYPEEATEAAKAFKCKVWSLPRRILTNR